MTAGLRVTTLGGVTMMHGDTPLTGFVSAKAQALICYLALTRRVHPRSTLATFLWQDLSESAAATNLRVVLVNLKHIFGPALVATRQTLGFDPLAAPWVDATTFCDLTATTQVNARLLQEADALYVGDFLAGFAVRNAPAFEEWALGQREMLRQRAIRMLRLLAYQATERAEYDVAADYLRRLLDLEPWLEEAHRALMVTLTADGRRGAALRQYERCEQLLSEELDVAPMVQTSQLYQAIRRGDSLGVEWERPRVTSPTSRQPDYRLVS
jgi:DNA-binding SARP family transcriptional activator